MSATHNRDISSGGSQFPAAPLDSPAEPHARSHAARRFEVGIIIALFLALGFAYSLVVPPFETPDEPFHYGFARHIAEGNGLPVQSAEETGPWAQEGSQAPLYYLLTGWLTRWIDQDDFDEIAVRNPRANIGDPLDPGNKNFMLYSGRQGPLTGSNLALHLGRWFSLLLGAVTLLCVYLTTGLLTTGAGTRFGGATDRRDGEASPAEAHAPARRHLLPLLATALVALIPQFLFISASFSNDTLIMAASAATVWWLARLLAKPAAESPRAWEWVVLGILLGIAALSKLQGLGLVPVAGLAAIFLAWRRSEAPHQSHDREGVDGSLTPETHQSHDREGVDGSPTPKSHQSHDREGVDGSLTPKSHQSHDREGVDGSLTLPALKEGPAYRVMFMEILRAALLVGLPALALAGWWYLRNVQLYGDWSGLGHLTSINGARAVPLTLEDFWPEFRGLRFSFWGLYGWFNILLPAWFYTLADLLTVAGVVGLAGATVQMVRTAPQLRLDVPPLRVLALLAGWAVLMFLLLVYWITEATGSQGRLIFPGMIAYGPLLALGVDWWLRLLPKWVRLGAWGGLLATLLGVSLYSLALLLPQSYNAPQPIAALPAAAEAVDLVMGDAEPVELVAVEAGAGRYRPGERVPVTLFWRTQGALTHDYQLFIQFLDESGREVANLTSHPGWGRNPTTFWQPGALYADPYQVLVTGEISEASPLLARVYTGLIDPASEEGDNLPLPARTADGAEVTPFVAAVELAAYAGPEVADLRPAAAVFGDVITLAGSAAAPVHTLGSATPFTVTLLWEALGAPATDYTAYVHLLDAAGNRAAGYDQVPAGERFPTSRWRAGDQVASTFAIDLPPTMPEGDYGIWVGLYESASNGALRLPVTDTGGLPSGDGQVEIGRISVGPPTGR